MFTAIAAAHIAAACPPGPPVPPLGQADWNRDGVVNCLDRDAYMFDWNAGDSCADVDDGSGTGTLDEGVDDADRIYFFSLYDAARATLACPVLDYDGDGDIDCSDISGYYLAWEAGSPCADVDDGSGTNTPDGGISLEDKNYFNSLVEGNQACNRIIVGSDDCATPADLGSAAGLFPFNTCAARTGTQGQGVGCGDSGGYSIRRDVWFKFTAPSSCAVTFSTVGHTADTTDTKMAIYTSQCPTSAATLVACNDNLDASTPQSRISFTTTANQTYYIQLGTPPDVRPGSGDVAPWPLGGTGMLEINIAGPSNDSCDSPDAIALPAVGATTTVAYNNACASTDGPDHTGCTVRGWSQALGLGIGGGASPVVHELHALTNGDLIAAGRFAMAGTTPVANIARWNGTAWSALGSGVGGDVWALAQALNGDVIAGGAFTIAGGVSASRSARWNGSAWTALGTGFNSDVYALAIVPGSGDIIAGGAFTIAGGVSASRIARWNGSAWTALGSGLNGPVLALAVLPGSQIIASGRFTFAGAVPVANIARWNGTSWSALGSGLTGTFSEVRALAVDPQSGDLYAGGSFTTAGGAFARSVARWNGTSWSELGCCVNGGTVQELAFLPNGELFAAGTFSSAGLVSASYVARWSGGAWSALGAGADNIVFGLATSSSGDVFIGGSFTAAGGLPASRVARWIGGGGSLPLSKDLWYRVSVPTSLGANTFGYTLQATACSTGEDRIAVYEDLGSCAASFAAMRSCAAGPGSVYPVSCSPNGSTVTFAASAGRSYLIRVATSGTTPNPGPGTLILQNISAPMCQSTSSTRTKAYKMTGCGNGQPWSWMLRSSVSYVGTTFVPGVVGPPFASPPCPTNTTRADRVRQAFITNINNRSISSGCGTLVQARALNGIDQNGNGVCPSGTFGISCSWMTITAPGPFDLFVGNANTTPNCQVPSLSISGGFPCVFNPEIEEIPLEEIDFNGNGTPDLTEIEFGLLTDADGDGIADEFQLPFCDAEPIIGMDPSPAAACVGVPASFSVAATGLGLTYQWRKGGVDLPGATSATLDIPAAALSDTGDYDCVVENACGTVISTAAALSILSGPAISVPPAGATVALGSPASFSVTATGTPPLTYQWRKDGSNLINGGNISGADTAVLQLASCQLSDSGAYDVVVTNSCGSMTSTAAALVVTGGCVERWETLGAGTNSRLFVLAVMPSGDVVAGGQFSMAGGVTTGSVARWNGTAWQALGTGINGQVQALAIAPTGDIIAGGTFSIAGGASASNIARWTGSAWQALGTGTNGSVRSLAVLPNGHVVAGGNFSTAGGTVVNAIARWDGAAWHSFGVGTNGTGTVDALIVLPGGDLVAGGQFTSIGGVAANRIARWNSTTWFPFGSGMNAGVQTLTVRPNGDLIAGGLFNSPGDRIARWNGAAWSPIGAASSFVLSLATLPNGDVLAGGTFTTIGGISANRVARWDGTTWFALGSGLNNEVDTVAAAINGEMLVGGTFTMAGGAPANFIAKYTSTAPPSIFTQPSDVIACPGASASFSITATGSGVTYQWRKGGADIAGSTSATHSIAAASAADQGEYDCVVISACGTATSDAATLTVCVADIDDGSGSGTCDGGVTIDDLLYYLFVFENGELRSDVDDGSGTGTPDGGVTIDDLLYYLFRFEAGC